MSRLFQLADRGRLSEPDFVAKTLDVKPAFAAETERGQRWDCSGEGVFRRILSAAWTPPWAKPAEVVRSTAGVEIAPEAQEWASSALEYGRLQVSYRQSADVECPSGRVTPDRHEATLKFDNLDTFACISIGSADLRWRRYQADLPRPRHHGEGLLTKVYRRAHAGYGVTIFVEFGADERCPQRITIRQSSEDADRS